MIKAIAFDLDDTLLDTTGLLAPKATREAFQVLINAGLKLTQEECEKLRQDWVKSMSHREVFEKLSLVYGDSQTQAQLQNAIQTFYVPDIPHELPLLEGARENIDRLKHQYPLYLVTAGEEVSQIRKAHALGVYNDFKKVIVVNSVINKRKKDVFAQIISELNIRPQEFLCIGNSLLSEIKDAMSLEAKTCYFEFGEERGSLQDLPHKPDYRIRHHRELIPVCQL